MTSQESASLQVDPKYLIETLIEENKAINDNRLYLVALLKQVQTEYAEEKAAWEAEKASLLKKE